MNIIWGVVLILFTLILCWLGQVINAIAPNFAAKIGLAEPEADVDPTYFIDGRGEAIWDALILWVLPVAGILLLIDNPAWAYFGLVGAGIYLYFSEHKGRRLWSVFFSTLLCRGIVETCGEVVRQIVVD